VVRVAGLPRLTLSSFHENLPLLWTAGVDLVDGQRILVPYEVVHLDMRVPLPTGSGAFLISSNGLASGNHILEAISHGICELIERDANALWHLGGERAQAACRLDARSVDDPACRSVLDRFEDAGVAVGIWETTSDLAVPSYLATIVDRADPAGALAPVSGSGCHPRRGIALLRALTEAAQGRLTIISGSRDDLSARSFERADMTAEGTRLRELVLRGESVRSFGEGVDARHGDFDEDVRWELARLQGRGFDQVIAVNLTRPEVGIPVVRMIIPGLEAMSETAHYAVGARGRGVAGAQPS
jgi:ribosomal protein S12 methylthiotransferase accessory factor